MMTQVSISEEMFQRAIHESVEAGARVFDVLDAYISENPLAILRFSRTCNDESAHTTLAAAITIIFAILAEEVEKSARQPSEIVAEWRQKFAEGINRGEEAFRRQD